MTMTDPIADLLTRIRNASMARQEFVEVPSSNMNRKIADILKDEGYLDGVEVMTLPVQDNLKIRLRYGPNNTPAFTMIKRVSKPGRRVYARAKNIPRVLGGLGLAIITTSEGLLTDREARQRGIGGEIICYVA